MEILVLLLSSALACFFAVVLTEALPWPQSWLERKPLSCRTCLAGWSAIAGWCLLGELVQASVLFWAATAGLCRLLLALHGWLEPRLPTLPPSGPPT